MNKHTPIHPRPSEWLDDKLQPTLNCLLNLMIPASDDGVMPAASALHLFNSAQGLSDEKQAVLAQGLEAISSSAHLQFDIPFEQLTPVQAQEMIDAMAASEPAFFALLKQQLIKRYYEHPKVLSALGIDPAPPWPRGHSVSDGDWSLLDPVRRGNPIYRQP